MPEIVPTPRVIVNASPPARPVAASSGGASLWGYAVAGVCGFGLGIVVMLGVMMLLDSPSEREGKLHSELNALSDKVAVAEKEKEQLSSEVTSLRGDLTRKEDAYQSELTQLKAQVVEPVFKGLTTESVLGFVSQEYAVTRASEAIEGVTKGTFSVGGGQCNLGIRGGDGVTSVFLVGGVKSEFEQTTVARVSAMLINNIAGVFSEEDRHWFVDAFGYAIAHPIGSATHEINGVRVELQGIRMNIADKEHLMLMLRLKPPEAK